MILWRDHSADVVVLLLLLTVWCSYSPSAISLSASSLRTPLAFLSLARLFWNQILTVPTPSPMRWASCCRRWSLMYWLCSYSARSWRSWSTLNAVRRRRRRAPSPTGLLRIRGPTHHRCKQIILAKLTWCATASVLLSRQPVYSMQWNNNASWRSTQIRGFRMEDTLNLRGQNSNNWSARSMLKILYAGYP